MTERRPWAERLELIFVFLAGFALLSHIYAWDLNTPTTAIGAPGNDSFYHTRMAALLPSHGLLHEFPWLRWTWFTDDGNRFVSHHYGFHVLLLPWVATAEWLGFDALTGGRWFMCTMLGLQLALLDAILIAAGIRYRLMWLALALLWPHQFFERQAFIRAIGPATVALLTLTWLLLHQRYLLLVFAIVAFLHLYLGAVLYVPVLIGAAVFAGLVTARSWRELPWQLLLAGVAGWGLGILSHPYQQGMFEFLQMQVFGTGLSPDIQVGREWRPYSDVWWVTSYLLGPMLLVLCLAVGLRLWSGKRLDAATLTLVLFQAIFLVLMFKARRFVEFWPPFALAAAGYLANPALEHAQLLLQRRPRWIQHVLIASAWFACGAMAVGLVWKFGAWPTMPNATWLVIAALLTACATIASVANWTSRSAILHAIAATMLLLIPAIALSTPRLEEARRNSRCRHRLATLETMMEYLRTNSPSGSIVFTDDWDVFPAYFYHNTHNRFVVGLDPKFTHERRPDLWDRYVRITRGQTPSTIATTLVTATGTEPHKTDVQLSDIRTHFEASYVIVDDDHRDLAKQLDANWSLAEPAWPQDPEDFRGARYRVYRVRAANEPVPPRPTQEAAPDLVYLDELKRTTAPEDSVFTNRLPDGRLLCTGTKKHLRGLSIVGRARVEVHAPTGEWTLHATVARADDAPGTALLRVVTGETVHATEELGTEPTTLEVALDNGHGFTLETIGPDKAICVLGSPLLTRSSHNMNPERPKELAQSAKP